MADEQLTLQGGGLRYNLALRFPNATDEQLDSMQQTVFDYNSDSLNLPYTYEVGQVINLPADVVSSQEGDVSRETPSEEPSSEDTPTLGRTAKKTQNRG